MIECPWCGKDMCPNLVDLDDDNDEWIQQFTCFDCNVDIDWHCVGYDQIQNAWEKMRK